MFSYTSNFSVSGFGMPMFCPGFYPPSPMCLPIGGCCSPMYYSFYNNTMASTAGWYTGNAIGMLLGGLLHR